MRIVAGSAIAALVVMGAVAQPVGSAVARYPNSMVVLGHSGATGYGSDPLHPYRDAPVNSWATGTNPTVKSVYSKILAVNPAIRGHNVNLAEDGATLKEFAGQVRKAVALTPKPDLVLVQIMDNDIKCDGRDETRYEEFGAGFSAALNVLAAGLPKARIFVVSPWGSFSSYAKTIQGLPLGARLKHAGKGPCSFFTPASSASPGRLVPEHVAYVKKIVEGFAAQLKTACSATPQCRYDDGAALRMNVVRDDLTLDQYHLSLKGQAKLAAITWTAMGSFIR